MYIIRTCVGLCSIMFFATYRYLPASGAHKDSPVFHFYFSICFVWEWDIFTFLFRSYAPLPKNSTICCTVVHSCAALWCVYCCAYTTWKDTIIVHIQEKRTHSIITIDLKWSFKRGKVSTIHEQQIDSKGKHDSRTTN